MDDETTLYDRIRAWADGTLGADEARRLEAALASDPDLSLAAEEYRTVHRMTATVAGPIPASRVTFEALARALDSEPATTAPAAPVGRHGGRWTAWGLAAAAALLVGLAAWLFRDGLFGDAPPRSNAVELASIPADAGAGSAGALPAALAGYRPVAEDRIRWLTTREEARAVAAVTGRPLLVYVAFDSCPFCVEMNRTTLRDREVLDLADRFVPVQIDAGKLPGGSLESIFRKGWPYFAVERVDGVEIASFPGRRDGPAFRERLEAALRESAEASFPWERVDAAAARSALLAARERAATDPAGARLELETFAKRLPGGPVADDVSHVLGRWRTEARFPDLRFAGAPLPD